MQVHLTKEAGRRLQRATGGNLGKQLALLYKGKLIAAPVIKDVVSEQVMISGSGEDWAETARIMVESLGKQK